VFRNREDAGLQLARRFQGRKLRKPVVQGIPRGGLVIGAVLAGKLSAELDVVLSRKLRAPGQPELAIGAVAGRRSRVPQPLH
jgi:putative phosphoribosyl transferase